ncbi:RNA polymerase sigma factor [Schlesneria paludicola]|uniref:RNA polymerase sigma factor n=1 Tax=Schlesneria paludicola TaxID=360056 RepID=UPI00029A2A3B|nr:sigma-70 family RNA polymerase sigma factor [Schlesneria paludicola]
MTTSEQLLRDYALSGDPACFRALVEELGGMVYAVGLRITGDPHAAEDLSQDCFLELARKASTIRTSVAGWLHSTATNRALNLIRSRKQDRKRLSFDAAITPTRETEDFSELQTLIDEAVDGLDQQLRQIVVSHYLEGKTQAEIAQRLGVDQSTVSRRLAQGLDDVRSQLRRMGVITSVTALITVLGHSSASGAPATLTETAAKIGLAGVGWTATKSSTSTLGLFLSTCAATAGNLLFYLICEGWLFALLVVVEVAAFVFPPKWFKAAMTELLGGIDPWSHPAFPFKRWTWTVPPRDWKSRLAAWLWVASVLNLVAFAGIHNNPIQWVQPSCMAIMGTVFGLIPALRLGIRVWYSRSNLRQTNAETFNQPHIHETWEMVATAMAYVIFSVSFLIAGAAIHNPEERTSWIRHLIAWCNLAGSVTFFAYAMTSRWRSRSNDSQSRIRSADSEQADRPPRHSNLQFVFMMLFLAGAIAFLANALLSAIISVSVLREPYVRMVPVSVVLSGGFALFSAIGFFSFLFRIRDRLVRWNYVFLLAVGIGLSAGGLTAIGYGDYLALMMPPSPERPAEQPLTAHELAAQEAVQELRRKYARVMSAVVPRVIPVAYMQRDDARHTFPIVLEAPPTQIDVRSDSVWMETQRRWLEQFEQPVPPELKSVNAFFVHRYFKVVSNAEKPVFSHTFVCASAAEARAIAAVYGATAIQKDYLVTVVFEKKVREPLTSNDQLILAIRHQLESADLSNGPPELLLGSP